MSSFDPPARSHVEAKGEDTIKQMGCVSSNPEDHIQFSKGHLDLGFDRLYLHTAGPGQDKFLLNHGRDVLPKLKS
jgi:coenzyme F420-dependent glucose-6-phosphate dehydrogenase